MEKISQGHPQFGHRLTRELHGSNNLFKAKWVDSGIVDTQPEIGHMEAQGSWGDGFYRPGNQLLHLCERGQLDKAVEGLMCMDENGNVPLYLSLLRACVKRKALTQAKQVHGHLVKHGLHSSELLGEYVVSTLVKCGGVEEAVEVFQRLPCRSVFSWTAVISGYTMSREGRKALRMYRWMQEEGVQPNAYTFVSLLKACGSMADLEEGKRIHAEVLKYSCESNLFVGNCLVDMYGKCGSLMDAHTVFSGLSHRDVVSWTAMLAACAEQGQAEKALLLYIQMKDQGVSSDARTFVSALQACSRLAEKEESVAGGSVKVKSLQRGKQIHADAQRKGYDKDLFVGNTLVRMYGKCGSIVDAQNVFDGLTQRDVVSWNAMLTGYVEQGQAGRTLELYEQMQQEQGIPRNEWTIVCALQACGMLADAEEGRQFARAKFLEMGKAIHADAQRMGYDTDVFVGSTLVSMYGKCGSIVDAWNVFAGLSERNVVSWNAMLAAYVEHGQAEKALHLYDEMQKEGPAPNDITMVRILQACSMRGRLGLLRQIHQTLVSSTRDVSSFIASSLISAYGRCASMVDAVRVFRTLPMHDVVPWNALIASYARQGNWAASLQYYEKMQLVKVFPDEVTFVSLLSACSHAGLVEKGVEYFESMSRDHGITPEMEHYVSLVDLLGRAGCFTMLEDLLSAMPLEPNLAMWSCLLSACQKHGKVMLGTHAFNHAISLQPKHPSAYVVMSNIYADAGLWDRAKVVKELRQKAGAWKRPGYSWIEHDMELHTFLVGDSHCPEQEQLHNLLEMVSLDLGEAHKFTTTNLSQWCRTKSKGVRTVASC